MGLAQHTSIGGENIRTHASNSYGVVNVGGGVVGRGVGIGLLRSDPSLKVILFESGNKFALHAELKCFEGFAMMKTQQFTKLGK